MSHLRLAAAQLNTVVGDLAGNVDRILAALAAAEAAGRRPLRGARAGHPGLPARGPPPQAGLRGRQRGRAGEGGRGHRAVRRRGRLRGGHARRHGPVQRAAVCAGGRVVGDLPQALPAQLRRVRRAALVRPERRDARPSSAWPGRGWASRSARTCGSPTARWPSRGGPGPTWWSTSTPRPTTGAAAASGWPCCAGGWPRPAAPSPTSTRSAGRTSWSSTATRSSWRPTARCWPAGPSSSPIWSWWTSRSAGGVGRGRTRGRRRCPAWWPPSPAPTSAGAARSAGAPPAALRRGRGLRRPGARHP